MQPLDPTDPPASLRAAALGAAALGLLQVGVAVLGNARAGWPGGAGQTVTGAITTISWLGTGAVVAAVRPRMVFGWLLLFGGMCLAASSGLGGLAVSTSMWPGPAWLGWIAGWIFYPHLGAYALIYLLFPTGALPSRRWRPWIAVAVVGVVAATVLLALAPGPLVAPGPVSDVGPLAGVPNPVGSVSWARMALPAAVIVVNIAGVAGLVALWQRSRHAGAAQRRSLRLVFALGVFSQVEGVLLIAPAGDWVYALAVPSTMLLTAAIAWELVRGRLWGVRETVGRLLTYLVASAVIAVVFVAATTAAGLVTGSSPAGVPVAALAVCLGLAPFQRRLQTAISRLLYGERHEPYAVLSAFGGALETAGEPVEGLRMLCQLAARSLQLPWVAVQLGPDVVAEHGVAQPQHSVRLLLRHHGQELGALRIGLRAGEAAFSAADRRLLDDLARQAGASAFAASLTASLRRSRDDLADVRERERRRLGRDLHDGVASALTAVGLKTEVALDLLQAEPDRCAALLGSARADLATALDDVRRMIDDLAPAVLADLGLAGALGALAGRFTTDTLAVHVRTDGISGPSLPPALEAAAYWITAEALQNVVRPACAARSDVTAERRAGPQLVLTIVDDGHGPGDGPRRGGVGIASMLARAQELGGTCTVAPAAAGGTLVTATFPLPLPIGAGHDR